MITPRILVLGAGLISFLLTRIVCSSVYEWFWVKCIKAVLFYLKVAPLLLSHLVASSTIP
jgi:hypothetical protein